MQLRSLALPASLLAATVPAAQAQVSFTQAPTVATGQRVGGAAAADLDGDGIVDLAVTTNGAAGNLDLVELYRGAGNGTFTAAGTVFLPVSSSPQGIVAADADGDGDMDLAVVLRDSAQLVMLTNGGAFAFANTSSASTAGAESREVSAADMDGDGDVDFVVANRDSNNVTVITNQGGALTFAGTTAAGAEPRDAATGDLDGDGLADVAVAAHDSRQVVILRGTGGGALAPSQTLTVPAGTRPSGMAMADVDGDGDLDVIAGTGDDNFAAQNFAALYINTGGTLAGPMGVPSGGLDAGDVVAADFDADGTIDLAVGNETSGTIGVMRGLGAGAFAAPVLLNPGGLPGTLVSADLDGNGSADLATTFRQAANVAVFLSDAAGGGGGPVNYCTANANSTGLAARMSISGTRVVANNDLVIAADQMPAGVFGIFSTSRTQGFTPNPGGSSGNLCLGGTIGRYTQVFQASGAGAASLAVNLNAMPIGFGSVPANAGETWNFQAWFRDVQGGVPTSNFSDGISVPLL